MLETMPDVLTWADDGGVCTEVQESYLELLGERMGQLLAVLEAIEPGDVGVEAAEVGADRG
jgi:hypothetical protein